MERPIRRRVPLAAGRRAGARLPAGPGARGSRRRRRHRFSSPAGGPQVVAQHGTNAARHCASRSWPLQQSTRHGVEGASAGRQPERPTRPRRLRPAWPDRPRVRPRRRPALDTVRVLWPSGTLQAEEATAGWHVQRRRRRDSSSKSSIASPRRARFSSRGTASASSSSPISWAAARWAIGSPLVQPARPARVRADSRRPVARARTGGSGFRVTNELEETLYRDRVAARVDPPTLGVEVYPPTRA